ncbi:RNA polymerase I-specific transcription initiation factor RRN3 isoform X1 [Mangifera indica]|uniref:RNA polymerase I-specific transcription initiation factor RRN3 isoform X1 n=1 Tax=Mangifera indica TaxID=29780 RepID=UPI001CFB844D|nr:RNA polymerase I-specific transcription initiation factor RRN3 isoform X1 [Mangifera indica]XP_044500527.1 RNA polymerase I-specific transcription initiation factor RRN3 isoform X1 [Mangifera indica]XP_044500536.1 RNA polymerase I-specific transcription initiation factor RRN3 isoform X1 [Mangifera indica]
MGMEVQNHKVESHEMGSISDSELVYHVKETLRAVPLGDRHNYELLVAVMHLESDRDVLEPSLRALSCAVSYLDIVHHEALLTSIFNTNMWAYEPYEMDALMALIISLAASNGKYVDSCLTMLVTNFTPPRTKDDKSYSIGKKNQVIPRVHAALKNITDLVPLAPLRLSPIVLQGLPTVHNKHDSLKMIVIYVENMLELEKGELGELVRCPMLMALVDRLIDLDVEIGWDDNSHDDSGKGIFEMDLEDTEEAACHAEQDIDKLPKGSLSWKSGKEQIAAELLDQLMVLTFEHLKSCQSEGRLIEVFDILLQSFQITVLNAYKSKFAQFVMFYACALDPENCGVRFSTMLAGLFVSGVHSQLTRMSAVSYLASFLSRAKFLSASFVIRFLKRLVDWCLEYCKVHGGDINPKAHRVFYSGCQAIMYVLCFRMRSIMDIPRLKSQLLLMPLETILKHELNPFKVCLPSVVCEFLRQSKAAHLFTVSKTFIFNDLLESELSRAFGGLERLDMFFPFDPCLLKKCDSYIRPNFVYWSMVRTTYHDDDEVDSSEEDVDEDFVDGKGDDVMEDGMRSDEEEDPDDDEFDYNALSKMSITPKNCVGLMVQ